MKNTYDEQIECLQHLKAGGKLEWYGYDRNWSPSDREAPSFDCHKYRPLIEKYHPEVGEMVICLRDGVGEGVDPVKFLCMDESKYLCKSGAGIYALWDDVKPLEQPKPVARKWFVMKPALWSKEQVLDQGYGENSFVHVREVLE